MARQGRNGESRVAAERSAMARQAGSGKHGLAWCVEPRHGRSGAQVNDVSAS